MSDLDTIRERHTLMRGQSTNASKGICYRCNATWPCDTRIVLDVLDEYERDSWYAATVIGAEWRKARADADRLAEALQQAHDEFDARGWYSEDPEMMGLESVIRHALHQHEEMK